MSGTTLQINDKLRSYIIDNSPHNIEIVFWHSKIYKRANSHFRKKKSKVGKDSVKRPYLDIVILVVWRHQWQVLFQNWRFSIYKIIRNLSMISIFLFLFPARSLSKRLFHFCFKLYWCAKNKILEKEITFRDSEWG